MAVDVNALRSFLVQSPRPSKILVTCGDGEEKQIAPPKGVGGITWMGLARSIETLDPAKVECFDAEDKLVRAQRFDAATPSLDSELPEVLKRDAESARIALFAKLIADAHKFAVDTAFSRMVELTERLDARLERMEIRLERTEATYRRVMQERIDEALEEAQDAAEAAEQQANDPAASIMQAFVGGAAQGAAGRDTEVPPPNGKRATR